MPVVVIPEAYRGPTKGIGNVRVSGGSVLECLRAVDKAHPGFLQLVLDDSGELHRFVKLFVNGDQLDGEPLTSRITEDDDLEVLAAIAGG